MFQVEACFVQPDLAAALQAYRRAAELVGLPEPTVIEDLPAESSVAGGWSEAERIVREQDTGSPRGLGIVHGDVAAAGFFPSSEGVVRFSVSTLIDAPSSPEHALRLAMPLAIELARSGTIGTDPTRARRALLRRDDFVRAAPDPPCSPALAHVMLLRASDVEPFYGSFDRLAEHGWSLETCPHGMLATRASLAWDELEFVRETMHHQRALARIAPPRATKYYALNMSEPVRRFYASPPATLRAAYLEAEQAAIYTAVLAPDAHVQGWEIDAIDQIVVDRALPDGRPVAEARVIFPDRATAEREKRPLLDVGARVLFLDASNALVDVPED